MFCPAVYQDQILRECRRFSASREVTGQVFNLQNVEFSMGSQQGVNLVIPDTHVSRTHCTVRFNFSNGMYEVRDLSTNGVYLLNGVRLQKGVYTPLQRGTIFCLGSVNQQFRLL